MQHFVLGTVGLKAKLLSRFVIFLLTCYTAGIGVASAQGINNEDDLRNALEGTGDKQPSNFLDLDGATIELTNTLQISVESGRRLILANGTVRPAEGLDRFFRLFEITGGDVNDGWVQFRNMTLENALYIENEPGNTVTGGAAVFSEDIEVVIQDSTVRNNRVMGIGNVAGGAVLVLKGELVIEDSIFEGNHVLTTGNDANDLNNTNVEASGGAVATSEGSLLTVENTSFNENSASRGGAIAMLNQSDTTSISRSTFSGNEALSVGGAIWARSRVEIELSTFYRNNAATGGGALFFQPLFKSSSSGSFLIRNTLVGNTGGSSGGDALLFENRLTNMSLASNLIISNGLGQSRNCTEITTPSAEGLPDLFAFAGNNLSDDSSCGSSGVSLVVQTAGLFANGLAELEDNGGPTLTIALDPEGQAVDQGGIFSILLRFVQFPHFSETNCTSSTIRDQRGVEVLDACDVGSYEVGRDADGDGLADGVDNCRTRFNPGQEDEVRPGFGGDVCDDFDEDSVFDAFDNCPSTGESSYSEFFQQDLDGDGLGDLCDHDIDGDLVDNDQDAFPRIPAESVDTDGDGIGDNSDNCPSIFTEDLDQSDLDGDLLGDVCDDDRDGDNIDNESDDFPDNITETEDTDGDGVGNNSDNCPMTANPSQEDADDNDVGDVCEVQIDVQPVTVFQRINFTGNSLNVGEGDVTIDDLKASSVGNDRISSIQIAEGYEVVACQDYIFTGRCEIFTDSVADLRSIGFNNHISSFRVRQPSTSPVTVFRGTNFGGDSLTSGAGDVSFEQLSASIVGNDRISSIEIADGFEVLACQDSGFKGRCEVFTDTVLNLGSVSFNNQISSFRVRVLSSSPVIVFRDTNFGGNFLSVEAGEVSFGELSASSIGNDQISSMQIADGFEVVACQDSGFRGQCEIFTNSVSDLRDISFNNFISSFLVREISTSPVTVYRYVGFRGNSLSVGEGDVTIGDLKASSVGNDRISSIQIAEGYEVVACQDYIFTGRCEIFTGSVSDLRGMNFNNVISSLRVQQQ